MSIRLDKLPVTRLHLLVVAICALGFGFDLLEIGLGNVLIAVFSDPRYAATPRQLSLLVAGIYIGAIVGAPLLGWLADRYGRRLMLMLLLLYLAAVSVFSALAPTVPALTFCRICAGMALGAYPPLMMAYLTDVLPPRHRGALVFVAAGAGLLGAPAGIFLIHALGTHQPLGYDPWRWAFFVSAAGASAAALLFSCVPESPRWLKVRGRISEAESECLRFERSRATSMSALQARNSDTPLSVEAGLPVHRDIGRLPLLALGAVYFLSPWSAVAFPLLTSAVLMQKGFRLSDTLLYTGISTFGPIIGACVGAMLIDRLERRQTLALCAIAMICCGLLFASSQQPVWLVTTSVCFGLLISISAPALILYGAEVFPTRTRASAGAIAWSLNRFGAVLALLVLLPLLHSAGFFAMVWVIVATLLATLLLLAFAPPRPALGVVD